jgi:glycosyltransferase involved in cell wall biosynthesis
MGGQKGIALFNRFLSKFVSLTCVTTKANLQNEENDYTIIPILSNQKWRYINIFYFFSIRKIIKKEAISHVIIEHPYYGWLGILLKYFCGVQLIVHSHNIESLRFKSMNKWWWKILWHYEKITHQKANINFFITDEDKEYAIQYFKIAKEKCHTITYGFDFDTHPTTEEKNIAKKSLVNQYKLSTETVILLFNGTLDYKPNWDALDTILHEINPKLIEIATFNYRIIICGKNLAHSYNDLKDYRDKNIIYAGFVEDISLYFKGADIFINPVIDGGGIKTKLVEALGANLYAISTKEGAIGVPEKITNNRLKIMNSDNWDLFAEAITQADFKNSNINHLFFDHFYWENIAKKASKIILKSKTMES